MITLKQKKIWCLANEKKIPVSIETGRAFSPKDRDGCGTYFEAVRSQEKHQMPYVGIVFFEEDGLIGIDVDKCMDKPLFVEDIVGKCFSYAEASMSGNGFHIIGKGEWQPHYKNRTGVDGNSFEMYNKDRFFVFTGKQLNNTPKAVNNISAGVELLQKKYFENNLNPVTVTSRNLTRTAVTEDFVIQRLHESTKGRLLWEGNLDEYNGDHSRADSALMSLLAFWTGRDEHMMESVFSQSALGQREKWTERADYRNSTIHQAIISVENVYQPEAVEDTVLYAMPKFAKEVSPNLVKTNMRQYAIDDTGLSQMFADVRGDDFRYLNDAGVFVVYNGQYWQEDKNEIIIRQLLEGVLESFYLTLQGEDDVAVARRKAAMKYRGHQGKTNIIREVRYRFRSGTYEPIALNSVDFDTDKHLLNTPSGVVDLRTGEQHTHSNMFLITKQTAISPDFAGKHPKIDKFLDDTFSGDLEVICYIKRMLGYFLTGEVKEQKFFILQGRGADGKSTLVNLFSHIMGLELVTSVSKDMMVQTKGANDKVDQAVGMLQHKRLAIISELEKNDYIRESTVKQLTGGDAMISKKLYRDPVTIYPTAKLLTQTNYKPNIIGEKAIWRRVVLIMFHNSLSPSQINLNLLNELKEEASAFLATLIEEAKDYYQFGLVEPNCLVENKTQYKEQESLFEEFIFSVVREDKAAFIVLQDLYNMFVTFVKDAGDKPPTRLQFRRELDSYGYPTTERYGKQIIKGLTYVQ